MDSEEQLCWIFSVLYTKGSVRESVSVSGQAKAKLLQSINVSSVDEIGKLIEKRMRKSPLYKVEE